MPGLTGSAIRIRRKRKGDSKLCDAQPRPTLLRRTMEQVDDLLAGAEVILTDEILDQIDTIVPPGTNIGIADEAAYQPPALQHPSSAADPVKDAPPPNRAF